MYVCVRIFKLFMSLSTKEITPTVSKYIRKSKVFQQSNIKLVTFQGGTGDVIVKMNKKKLSVLKQFFQLNIFTYHFIEF